MRTVELSFFIRAPRETVFDAITDNERFFGGPPVDRCRVVQPGQPGRDGLGAVRVVHAGGVRFEERITHHERPARADYLVLKCSLPLEHEGGQVHFVEQGQGTEVRWFSRFTAPVPVGSTALEKLYAAALTTVITQLLVRIKHELEDEAPLFRTA